MQKTRHPTLKVICRTLLLSLPMLSLQAADMEPGKDLVNDYLNKGTYSLKMTGDNSWLTNFTIDRNEENNINIDGGGHTLTLGKVNTGLSFSGGAPSPTALHLTNVTVTRPKDAASVNAILLFNGGRVNNIHLEGATFTGTGGG
jgi:hypothetical protein